MPAPQSLPMFDPGVLGDMFNGDTAIVAAVLETFASSMRAGLPEVQAAMVAGDLQNVASLAHKIKGACAQSGALAMGQAARLLEQTAKSGDGSGSTAALREMATQWQTLQTVLAAR